VLRRNGSTLFGFGAIGGAQMMLDNQIHTVTLLGGRGAAVAQLMLAE
jgi:hypothetical protein